MYLYIHKCQLWLIPSLPYNGVVNGGARRQVIQSFGSSANDLSRDAFLYNHHRQLQLVVLTKYGETAADLRKLPTQAQ